MTNLFEVSTTFRSYFTNYTWFFLHYVATEGEAQSSMTYQHFYCNSFIATDLNSTPALVSSCSQFMNLIFL